MTGGLERHADLARETQSPGHALEQTSLAMFLPTPRLGVTEDWSQLTATGPTSETRSVVVTRRAAQTSGRSVPATSGSTTRDEANR